MKAVKKEEKEVKLFSIQQLQAISLGCGVLKTCNGVQPFALSNRLNRCQLHADAKLVEVQGLLDIVNKREGESDEEKQVSRNSVWTDTYPLDGPLIKEDEFAVLEITGEKKVHQIGGDIKEYSYREAYFSLLGLVIL